jgi:hypothetical protein
MSLKSVLYSKTQKERKSLLSRFLKENSPGSLSTEEKFAFKQIFVQFYTPDEEYTKFTFDEIEDVAICKDTYGNHCFKILVMDEWYPSSISRLCGGNRTKDANLRRALRTAINIQIEDFKLINPKCPDEKCPVLGILLGYDAEVDHEIPFHHIVNRWLSNHKDVTFTYDLSKHNYSLDEPYLSDWRAFHKKEAKLRWVSKKGNQIAHQSFNGKA